MPYLGKSPQHGNYSKLDDFSGDFDGSDATHAIASNGTAITPVRPEALIISINGVIQEPTTDYTVSGTNITFTTAPTAGDNFFGVAMGEQLQIGTPSDATITSAKLSGNLVTPGTLDVGGTLGVITAHDLGAGVHVRTSDTGGSVSANSDELVLEGDGNAGLTILSKNDSVGQISFGDGDSTQKGIIQYAHGTDRLEFYTNDTKHMQIDSTGAITKPLQPCVMVHPASTQSNIAASTTVDIIWGTERFDIGGDFASNTFVAPVTGRYQVNVELRLDNLDTAANYLALYALSSNKNYASSLLDYSVLSADAERWIQSFSGIIDMDASDTFKVQVYIDGGSAQTDVDVNSFLSIGLFS